MEDRWSEMTPYLLLLMLAVERVRLRSKPGSDGAKNSLKTKPAEAIYEKTISVFLPYPGCTYRVRRIDDEYCTGTNLHPEGFNLELPGQWHRPRHRLARPNL